MKKFICLSCGSNEYSSTDNGEPCQRCMGKMVEVPMNRRNLLDLALNNSCNGCNLTPCCDFEALGNLATNLIE